MSSAHIPVKALDKDHLHSLIKQYIKDYGLGCSLNHIDVSQVTDMSGLFDTANFSKFIGDISQWDVSNVIDMNQMFYGSRLTSDISHWNVSKVRTMEYMFGESAFNGDISQWDVSNVINMKRMFHESRFNGDISQWDVSNVKTMYGRLADSKFNGDISNWNVGNVIDITKMFSQSEFRGDLSKWQFNSLLEAKGVFTYTGLERLQKPNIIIWLAALKENIILAKQEWQEHLARMQPLVEALYSDPLQAAIACHTQWMEIQADPNIDSVSVSNMELEIHA